MDLFAKQTIGFSAGFDLKPRDEAEYRTTICFGSEYLRKVNDKEDCGAYFGGFTSYHTSSQDEFKKNIFKVVPKIEYHLPITQSRETQLVGDLKGFYFLLHIKSNYKKPIPVNIGGLIPALTPIIIIAIPIITSRTNSAFCKFMFL